MGRDRLGRCWKAAPGVHRTRAGTTDELMSALANELTLAWRISRPAMPIRNPHEHQNDFERFASNDCCHGSF